MTREAELENLLSMLFPDPEQLRRRLYGNHLTYTVTADLPGPTATKADIVHKAAQQLEAQGLVPEVLEALAADPLFERRKTNIHAVLRLWARRPESRSVRHTIVHPASGRESFPLSSTNKADALPMQGLIDVVADWHLSQALGMPYAALLRAMHGEATPQEVRRMVRSATPHWIRPNVHPDALDNDVHVPTLRGLLASKRGHDVDSRLRQLLDVLSTHWYPPHSQSEFRWSELRNTLAWAPNDLQFLKALLFTARLWHQPHGDGDDFTFSVPPAAAERLACQTAHEVADLVEPIRTPQPAAATSPMSTQAYTVPENATIGILTALPKELAAVRVMLDNTKKWTAPSKRSRTSYFIGEVPSDEGGVHVVAVAMLPDMGNNSAALSAKTLLDHFPNVRHLIMCGIAGGVPNTEESEHDVRLGDIVVSNRNGVVQYDMQKLTTGRRPELRHPPRPPGRELLDAVRYLETEALLGEQPWEAFLERGSKVKKAVRPVDNLNAKGEPVDYPEDPERDEGLPRVFSGAIGSSNTLLKFPDLRDQLRSEYGIKAIEMEGSGVADASWFDGQSGYLVVRGICDYCDENKGDLWQGYAAVAAAAYVRALLESMAAEEFDTASAGGTQGSPSSGGVHVSGSGNNVIVGSPGSTVSGQHIHNYGSVGQQVNVSGDATFDLGSIKKRD